MSRSELRMEWSDRRNQSTKLRDRLIAFAADLRESGLAAEHAVVRVKEVLFSEELHGRATEIATRCVLDAYYPD